MTDSEARLTLSGTWHALETADVESHSLASLALDQWPALRARIALDAASGRHLLVPTGMQARPWSQINSPLTDTVRSLSFGGLTGMYLDVRCAEVYLLDVFDELIVDVLEGASGASDPGTAVDASLTRWRAMFRAVAAAGFGRERRFGLFAELLVLEASTVVLGSKAVAAWVGPSGACHDFELPSGCVEVKAIGTESTAVTIHGFDQLDRHREKPLWLLVYTLTESPTGRTIRDLVASIEASVGEGSLSEALARLGFNPDVDDRLAVIDAFPVLVDDSVPALTRRSVAEDVLGRVRRVEYDISVNVLQSLRETSTTAVAIAAAAR